MNFHKLTDHIWGSLSIEKNRKDLYNLIPKVCLAIRKHMIE